jgi:hypothetical protein
MLGNTMCFGCARFRPYDRDHPDGAYCAAFPEGIPDDLLFQNVDHTQPYPGDNGIRFLAKSQDEDQLVSTVTLTRKKGTRQRRRA